MKRILPLPIIFIVLQLTVIRCANIVPPSGGPRDSLPPMLTKVTPPDSTRNFSGSRIVFTFDEYIDVQNINEQLIVSPITGATPTIDHRLNTLTVKWKDELESNTTYSINFGEAVRDYTEGNPLKGFTYTFSTGTYIDSLELRGNVILAETGKIDTTLIVMLHTSADDSAVIRERPRYIAKLNSAGNFVFKNLPPRSFHIYALKDEGGTRRYFNDRQLFAFADAPVVIGDSTASVTLYAYSIKNGGQAPAPPVTGPRIKKPGETTNNRLRYQTNLQADQHDLLNDLIMSFDLPLRQFDSTKIRLYTDTTFSTVNGYSWLMDSTKKRLTLKNAWKEGTAYHIILDKDFAEDSVGRKLFKSDTLSFRTKKLSDYGSLKLRLKGLDLSLDPVLQFVISDVVIKSVPLKGNEYNQAVMLPGEYELRILYDRNKNGRWDPGEFFGKHLQPEIVKPIERRIVIKSNFTNEVEVQL